MKLFGYTISKEDKVTRGLESFTAPDKLDGALERSANDYGFTGFTSDMEGITVTDESALITKYRNIAKQPEVDRAIDDIVNEAIVYDDNVDPVSINLDSLKKPDSFKDKIRDEFNTVLKLMNFKNESYEIFRRFYVDGRIYYHKIIDEKSPKKGVLELRYIDPRRIRKVRERKLKNGAAKMYRGFSFSQDVYTNSDYDEYFLYNPAGIEETTKQDGVRITLDTICYVHSGLMDQANKHVISNLHKAIKIFNQLRWIEDSLVIYRVARAPERRVFNIEVGDLPKNKAEEYVQNLIRSMKKRTYYDASTGEVADDRRFSSIMEDYWFPKRDGKGTTVDQLAGGQNLGDIEDVQYFKTKLYEALNVPSSRMEATTGFNLGRSSEISRDEVKFSKFITRLRKRFNGVFDDILGTQLVLKGILKYDEWLLIKEDINYDYVEDNFFTELKKSEIIGNRFQQLQMIENSIGTFVSKTWVAKNVLQLTDEEWEQMKKEMDEETADITVDNHINSQLNGQDINMAGFGDDEEDYLVPKKPKKPKEPSTEDIAAFESQIRDFIKNLDGDSSELLI